jgi:hypothetical protein
MREKFEEILKEHGIYGEDVEEILYAVQDMMETVIAETEEKEPYATNSIKRMEMASYEIFCLTNLLD